MAFVCSREKPLKSEGEGFRVNLSKWFNSDKVQAFIQEHQTQVRADAIDRGTEGQDVDKTETSPGTDNNYSEKRKTRS